VFTSPTRALLLAILSFSLLDVSRPPDASGTALASLTVGLKSFKYWNSQPAQSLDLMYGGHGWPLLLDGFVCRASGKDRDAFDDFLEGSSYEAGLGIAKVWNIGTFHPHLAGGASRVWWRTHITLVEEPGEGTFESKASRLWLAGGGFWSIGSGFHLGAAVRLSELRAMYPSLGGTHAGISFGWGSPETP